MKNLYIRVPDEKTYNNAILNAMLSPWLFGFPNRKNVKPPKYEEAKKFYHGNSKLLLHLFFNSITGEHEMQITTASTEKTYSKKPLQILAWEQVNYEFVAAVFGDKE